jgi:imidazolonepropionase-like amidohydrolase
MMKQRGTWLVPTLMAAEYSGRRARNYPPEIAAKGKAAADSHSAVVRKAIGMGVKIAFGTDSAVSPHGLNAQEFGLLVEHGMTPAAALRSATSAAATLLGIEESLGTLEAGKQADIVAVPGDPTADVKLTEKVAFVMKAGRVYKEPRR